MQILSSPIYSSKLDSIKSLLREFELIFENMSMFI